MRLCFIEAYSKFQKKIRFIKKVKFQTCYHCSKSNTCDDPDRPPNITSLLTEPKAQACLCQSVSHYCVTKTDDVVKWWNPNNYTVFPVTDPPTPSPDIEEAFGLAVCCPFKFNI